ncbi:MAG TPA: type II toxin-antitoxin system HicB family antitoxin [candidate division Zixibacteria bacterium]|nr:type II toxin-antitoxin system HicB family antitoxin [candidate division Zixibacteria bacterium]
MSQKKYIYWQDGDTWLGYLEEYPDYMTQGETFEELVENLNDIYAELNEGKIPCVRKTADLEVV